MVNSFDTVYNITKMAAIKKAAVLAVCLFIIIACFIIFVPKAEAAASISGRVLDANGSPYSARVSVYQTVDIYTTHPGVEGSVGSTYNDPGTGDFTVNLISLGGDLPQTLYVRIENNDTFINFDYASVIISSHQDVIDVGDLQIQAPNVQGILTELDGELVIEGAGIFFYDPEGKYTDVAMAQTGEGGHFSFYMNPGARQVKFSTGNFTSEKDVEFTVGSSGITDLGIVTMATSIIPEDEVYLPDESRSPDVPSLIGQINNNVSSKSTIGLNVHWALGGDDDSDANYLSKLDDSNAVWVREHFSIETNPTESASWMRRYNKVINNYRDQEINVVGMLAYGLTEDDYSQPDLDAWSDRVTAIVNKWGDYVRVWEIWNEPDHSNYLNPNTVANYVPILKIAYSAIKAVDPEAIVLGGVFSWPYANYVEQLYQQADDFFDYLSFHVYYCSQYFRSGSHSELQSLLNSVKRVIDHYDSGGKAWVTELGCSTSTPGVSISQDQQRDYLNSAVSLLLNTGWIQNVFLYNFRNTQTNDDYEDNFGLVTENFSTKPAWDWYVALGSGAGSSGGGGGSTPVASGTNFFAYDSGIRGGFHISGGNVMGNSKAEIISGTGQGMAPHVRVFDENGELKSQFYAYDESLRNGVTITACDVNNDGYDEIVTGQGSGGWPLLRIFDGYGNQLSEFNVLDGTFTGGFNLSCGDTNGDGVAEIVVAARQGGGPHVLVYDLDGNTLVNFMAYDQNFRGGINVATIDMDGDNRDEIVTGPQFGAPHVQIFQIRPNELKRLSPGFYAFNSEYRGGVDVGGTDTDGDGVKELIVSVGNDATPFTKVYNIQEEIQKEFFVFGTNFLGGVNNSGADVDGDGIDELLVIPRGGGGPNVRIIDVDEI